MDVRLFCLYICRCLCLLVCLSVWRFFKKRVSFSVPLREDIAFFTDYLLQLVETKNLEQLWRVLRFLDRYNCNQPHSQGPFFPTPRGTRDEIRPFGHVSQCQIYLKGFQFFRIPSLLVFVTCETGFASLLENSLSISQQSFIISTTLPTTFETGSGNYKRGH